MKSEDMSSTELNEQIRINSEAREAERQRRGLKTYVVAVTSPTLGQMELARIFDVAGPCEAIHRGAGAVAHTEEPHGELEVTFRVRLYQGEDIEGEDIEFTVEG
jgi:hypothetical protein